MIRANALTINFHNSKKKTNLKALVDVNFAINKGEFVAIIGPSGCGKSTLINAIAGFLPFDEGAIYYQDSLIEKASRERVVIFQNHSLFPWKTAKDNIAFALRARGVDSGSVSDEAMKYLKMVELEEYAHLYPKELSGGMQQRVGIARALAADPEVFLLDEPFASLDQFTRDRVQEQLIRIIKPLNKTAILVTHNINEALFFADRIFIMSGRPGTITQVINIDSPKPESVHEIDNDDKLRKIKNTILKMINQGELHV